MGLNNNYGIKTVGKGNQVALNGKWPILGFDVNNLATTFRTTRVIDSKVNDFYNTGNTKPASGGQNVKTGVTKVLLASYRHGYSYRPMGYYTITGTFNAKCKTQVAQTASGTEASAYGGTYTINSSPSISPTTPSVDLFPKMNEFYMGSAMNTVGAFNLVTTIGSSNNANIVVPATSIFFGPGAIVGSYDQIAAWVSVEMDNNNVYIYMNYTYYDIWYRATAPGYFDIDSRVRMVADTSGSTYDVNVYLTPYKLEDLIQNG